MKLRKKKIAWLFIALLFVSIVLALVWQPLLDYVTRKFLLTEISRRINAEVTLSRLDLSFIPPKIYLKGLEMKRRKGPLRYISVEEMEIHPGLGAFFVGEVSLRKVFIRRPTLQIDVTDETPVKEKKKQPDRFRIPTLNDLLRIRVKEVQIDGAKLALRLPFQDLRVRIGAGNVAYQGEGASERWSWTGKGEIFRGKRQVILDHVAIVADRKGQNVDLKKFMMKGLGFDLNLSGPAYPEANLLLSMQGKLEPIESVLTKLELLSRPLNLSGHVKSVGKIEGRWNALRWKGSLDGASIAFRQRKFDRASFHFELSRKRIERVLGKVSIGDKDVHILARKIGAGFPGSYTVTGENLFYPKIQYLIDPGSEAGLEGRVNVEVEGQVGFRPWVWNGKYLISSSHLKLDIGESLRPFLPLEFQEVKVSGEVELDRTGNAVKLNEGKIQALGLQGSHQFQFGPKGAVEGSWGARVSDLSKVFSGKDSPHGMGEVGGGLEAGGGDFHALLDLRFEQIQLPKRSAVAASGEIVFEKGLTQLKDIKLFGEDSELRVNALLPSSSEQRSTIQGAFTDFDLGWISDLAAKRYPIWKGIEGKGNGQLSLYGMANNLQGEISFQSNQSTWKSMRFDNVDVRLKLKPKGIEFVQTRLSGTNSSIRLLGSIEDDEFKNLQAVGEKIPLSAFSVPGFIQSWVDHCDSRVVFSGPVDNPLVQGDFSLFSQEQSEKRKNIGLIRVDGELRDLSWFMQTNQGAFDSTGRVNLKDQTFFKASGEFKEFSLKPWLSDAESLLVGQWNLEGDLQSSKKWNGKFNVEKLTMQQGDWSVGLQDSVQIEVKEGVVKLPQTNLIGSSTEFEVEGKLNATDKKVEGKVFGQVNLRALALLPWQMVRSEGMSEINARIGGTLDSPQLVGNFSIRNGLIQFRGFPHTIESIQMQGTLDQNQIFVDQVKATLGEGSLVAQGMLFWSSRLAQTKVKFNGEADHINLRFPVWLPAELSGRYSLTGPISRPLFEGDFTVHKATYRDEWDWKSRILTFRQSARFARIYRSEEEHIQFNLLFRSEGKNFFLKNNLASARMDGELRLVGTDQALGLLGKVEVIEGEVEFLDNTFELSSGIVNFNRRETVNASFDINARTRVQDTEILLDIRTEKDDVVAFLSSTPPKDETNIIALLTLGVDADELIASGAAGENLSSSILPSVLAGPVQSRLQTGLKKAKLVDTLQFVPYFSEDTKTTGLKMIVGKNLFHKVRLLYSTDLFEAGAENTVRLEQSFNEHVSLQGSLRDNREEDEEEIDVGIDFEFKFEF